MCDSQAFALRRRLIAGGLSLVESQSCLYRIQFDVLVRIGTICYAIRHHRAPRTCMLL